MNRDLFVRSKANPIIKPTDLPFNVNGALNPGVAMVDGEVVLLLRIENRRGCIWVISRCFGR
jgi:beta-1,2-mannobiose phosphorylase / 1,2-beta-oligomannan phosphorylase